MVEICCYSLESCVNAQLGGAGRIELCASRGEGGLTPSIASIVMARNFYRGEIFVMIRPRGGDFLYSELEFEQMKNEIRLLQTVGIDGFVFGLLEGDGSIAVERTKELVQLAAPLKVCFHRAFDVCREPLVALEQLIDCGCHRMLTSAQCNQVMDGLPLLAELVRKASGRIEIMAGSGVNPSNAAQILATGVDAIHASATRERLSAMSYVNEKINFGSQAEEDRIYYADVATIEDLVRVSTEV